jgi:hypothetical protein
MTSSPSPEISEVPLPSISIVIPNFNGGATIEATLLSLIEHQQRVRACQGRNRQLALQ